MAFNTPEIFEAHYSVPMTGGVLNTINIRLDANTIAYILDHSEAKVLVVDRQLHAEVKKALKILGERTVDLIITDINMPNMDGIELIKHLRAQKNSKYTPILVITTEGGTNVKEAGKSAGASGWILKPFSPDILEKAVTKLANLA